MPEQAPMLTPNDFIGHRVVLAGDVDWSMHQRFRDQLYQAPADGQIIVEVTTIGGDPEVARLMGEDIRYQSELAPDRRIVFLGKAAVYSAGATLMSYFTPSNRYLARGTRLMIHERKLDKAVRLEGPVTTCLAQAKALQHEIEAAIAIQIEGFENLIRGSQVSMDELLRRAPENWYLEANEAHKLGLVAGVL